MRVYSVLDSYWPVETRELGQTSHRTAPAQSFWAAPPRDRIPPSTFLEVDNCGYVDMRRGHMGPDKTRAQTHLCLPDPQHANARTPRGGTGDREPGHARALPRRLGPRRRPHAARHADQALTWLRRFQGRERDVLDESASVCLGRAGRQCIEAVLHLATDEVRVDVRAPSRSDVFRYGQHVSAVERVFTRHNPLVFQVLETV